jgi:hypothetical protein
MRAVFSEERLRWVEGQVGRLEPHHGAAVARLINTTEPCCPRIADELLEALPADVADAHGLDALARATRTSCARFAGVRSTPACSVATQTPPA